MTINPQNVVDRPMPIRWFDIVELLPKYDWNVTAAAREANYQPGYISTRLVPMLSKDVRFCEAVERKKAEIQAKSVWNVQKCQQKLVELALKAERDNELGIAKGAIDSLIRSQGGFIDKSVNLNANADLPPTTPEERSKWLQDYARLEHDAVIAGHALASECNVSNDKEIHDDT